MTYSLNEVEAEAKRATRGAGYPWGLAEEAGKAARWLCRHGLDGCGALARLLAAADAGQAGPFQPKGRNWMPAGDGMICPLAAGTALGDAPDALDRGALTLVGLAEPLLLLPFLEAAAEALDATLTVSWDGGSASVSVGRLMLAGRPARGRVDVTLTPGTAQDGKAPPPATRAAPAPADWDSLTAFAHRTYAPATEASRLRGAGAGTSDND